jgi:radical SAM/Cys-rich protein
MSQYPNFAAHVKRSGTDAGPGLIRSHTKVLQLNIGFYCNQACTHCHVDSSPKRKEMMTREVAQKCVDIAKNSPTLETVDLTGGAPELNREFRFLVEEFHKLGLEIIDRCNLTVLLEPKQSDLGQFLADHKVHIIASLPCYLESNVASQRGNAVFERSIKGLQMLNDLGYGKPGSGLELDLVYNPTVVHLPPAME